MRIAWLDLGISVLLIFAAFLFTGWLFHQEPVEKCGGYCDAAENQDYTYFQRTGSGQTMLIMKDRLIVAFSNASAVGKAEEWLFLQGASKLDSAGELHRYLLPHGADLNRMIDNVMTMDGVVAAMPDQVLGKECFCRVVGYTEPFPYYIMARGVLMLFIGPLFYFLRNRPQETDFAAAVLAMFVAFALIYLLLSHLNLTLS